MPDNHMIEITVFAAERGDKDWPFDYGARLADIAAWFNTKWSEVPLEYSAVAKCEIGATRSYDEDVPTIKITYSRPETASERGERLAATENREARQRERELTTLRSLQAKYPGQT